MLDPIGPHPPSVYWRRRAAALGGVVVVLVLAVWAVGAALGGDDPVEDDTGERVLGSASLLSRLEQPVPSSSPSASASAASSGETTSPANSGSASAADSPTPEKPSPTPGPPGPCPDEAIKLTSWADRPQYRIGEKPALTFRVENVGPVPCYRDVSELTQELVVFSADDATRYFSSNDCYPGLAEEPKLLKPGENRTSTIRWVGNTSKPGCPVKREQVPAGEYVVHAKLGHLTGPPAGFRFVR
ncbi:hypothetical protein GCM10012275_14490 [Longimycelium tulufanense]|uniref:Uncharacterized protein n=1 Tax=Longimycelium tulufanense TaxID=907463 RepID=A0A8J3CDL4_9PSEU|nr:hypothetical protein [Longimycelium tulufanense]GGM44569.1 hypothetical protein GCM10012275_14490 [Longimycelium tulufanense]